MLEELVAGTGTDHAASAAWTEIWAVVATGKASALILIPLHLSTGRLISANIHHFFAFHFAQAALLLPTEIASSREPITPEFMKDHIIFCNGPERENAPVVTLSGLRGTIE